MHAQITLEERYAINVMRRQRYSIRAIAREIGRAPSTVSRELRRNLRPTGRYVPDVAHSYATARRRRSRRNARITPETWQIVERYLRMDWSPEQVAGFLRVEGILRISHETIYIHVWADKMASCSFMLLPTDVHSREHIVQGTTISAYQDCNQGNSEKSRGEHQEEPAKSPPVPRRGGFLGVPNQSETDDSENERSSLGGVQ
jgi:IS30 family transposase